MHGWIILDKPVGMGSTQAVGAVKRILREAGYPKPKIGHGGTLDPLAEGVLPIALGEATKLAGRMLDASKIYDFTIAFGAETDSLDLEGTVIETSDVRPTLAAIEAVLPQFTGPIEQVPPAYSALKVDGKRAYDLARAGELVALQGRWVEIFALERSGGVSGTLSRSIESAAPAVPKSVPETPPLRSNVTLTAHVSKGTYIRSLARDIARALGTVGHVTMLRRTKAGPFTLENAISLDFLAESAKRAALEDVILPLRTALVDIPALALTPEQAGALRQGRSLSGIAAADGLHFAELDTVPVALVDVANGTAKVERGFNC